jgi:acyl-CoA oxidase
MKLIPLLATCFGFAACHKYVHGQYKQLLEDIKVDKFDLLDELHHFTSGMKSVFTQTTNDGLFQIRQSVGGAGFTAWSGLPYIIDDYSPCVTFEGDNTVMA